MNTSALRHHPTWAAAVAEASAWIALLHGPDRTVAAEQGLKRWLAESSRHRQAFNLATEIWMESRGAVKRAARVSLTLPGNRPEPQRRRLHWHLSAAAAAALLLLLAGAVFFLQQPAVVTGIGERRILALEDGTQVYLNTSTRVVVDYGPRGRHVHLETGEAIFEVAKRPDWPFVVTVGDRKVTALGTEFLVRHDRERVMVTLVDGKVAVASLSPVGASVVLKPGERLTCSGNESASIVDRPDIGKLTAWQRGKVHIDNLTLGEAIAEMNRYSRVKLAVAGTDAAKIRLSGIFAVGDARNFANAVALTHGLEVKESRSRIVLSEVSRVP